jgi:hypothetical protein
MEKWLDGPGQRSAGLHCSYGLGLVDSFPINQITSQLLQDLLVQKYKTSFYFCSKFSKLGMLVDKL